MVRRLILILLMLAPVSARAQGYTCPFVTIGWSQTWPGQQLSSASYDSALQLLYVVFNGLVYAYSNVPTSVITSLTYATNPTQTYQLLVVGTYHSILLAQVNNCPIQYETGAYLWAQ